jgi:hypothetical protein
MPVTVQWPASGALVKKLRAIKAMSDMSGKGANRVKGDIRKIALDDNVEKLLGRGLLEGVDRYGKPLAPLAKSTYQNPKRGFGPALAPRGLASRFITNLKAEWVDAGGFAMLVLKYVGIVNKKGQSFAQYHLTGCPKGSKKSQPNWSLPKRDVGGITPAGWARIRTRFKQFASDILRGQP